MAKFVIKKDGKKEPFDVEKIKAAITAAASRTDLSDKRIKKVVKKASKAAIKLAKNKEEIATAEIREKVLSELDALEPSVSEAWRKPKKKKSDEEIRELGEEIADIIFALCCLANSKGIDLDESFKRVMDKCYTRDKDRFEKK